MNKPFRLALLPIVCATALSACAYHDYENRVVTRTPATTTVAVANTSTFDQLDINHDGFLSRAELASLGLPERSSSPTVLSFERLDQNRDGFLSRAEAEPLISSVRLSGGRWIIIAPTAWSFERLDIDRDGFLTRREAAPFISGYPRFARKFLSPVNKKCSYGCSQSHAAPIGQMPTTLSAGAANPNGSVK